MHGAVRLARGELATGQGLHGLGARELAGVSLLIAGELEAAGDVGRHEAAVIEDGPVLGCGLGGEDARHARRVLLSEGVAPVDGRVGREARRVERRDGIALRVGHALALPRAAGRVVRVRVIRREAARLAGARVVHVEPAAARAAPAAGVAAGRSVPGDRVRAARAVRDRAPAGAQHPREEEQPDVATEPPHRAKPVGKQVPGSMPRWGRPRESPARPG